MRNMLPSNWVWKAQIPEMVIDALLAEKEQLQLEDGQLSNGEVVKTVRNSSTYLLNPIHWFAGSLHGHAMSANVQAGWNLDVSRPETLQIADYDVGQFYDWHTDSEPLDADYEVRKITTICMLSDASEYEAGELEIKGNAPYKMGKGDIISFPSMLAHRVIPVTSGKRTSATVWTIGKRVG